MKTKLFSTLIATALISGCASTPHQYDEKQSYAWNLSQAAEMGSVMKDDVPTDEFVKGWGVIGNTGYAAIQSGFSFGSLFGAHMLGGLAMDSSKKQHAVRTSLVTAIDVEGKTDKEVGLDIANTLANVILETSPNTEIYRLSHRGFYSSGGACEKVIKLQKSFGRDTSKIEKIGCYVALSTKVLNKNNIIETDLDTSNIVRVTITGDYPINAFSAAMPDNYFYYPPFHSSRDRNLWHPAVFVKNNEAFLFIKPKDNNEFKTDVRSIIPNYEKGLILN